MRRRGLMAHEASAGTPYVTNGLILHLDGINRGGVSGQWKDLVNGRVFSITGTYAENADNVDFTSARMAASVVYDFKTIEFVINYRNTGYGTFLKGNTKERGIYTATRNNGSLQFGAASGSAYLVGNRRNELISVSALFNTSYTDIKINSVTQTPTSNGEPWGSMSVGTEFGMYLNNYPLQGKIYAIRYYDRLLTDAERTQNYLADKARFNIA